MATPNEMLQAAIDRKTDPVYRSSKASVIDYYQDTYGAKNWTRRIAEDLYGTVKNRQGQNVSVSNIMRRFQGTRASAGEGRSGAVYQELGKKLPSVGRRLRGNELVITVEGKQTGAKGRGERDRTLEATLKGSNAQQFIANPSFYDLWELSEEYSGLGELFEDGDYAIDVYAVS